MKTGAENRKKTIAAGILGTGALIGVISVLSQSFGGGSAPVPPPSIVASKPPAKIGGAIAQNNAAVSGSGRTADGKPVSNGPTLIAGVGPEELASTSSSLDPTLHQEDMLRAEHLVYAGSGRNIFSANYMPPPVAEVKPKFTPRPGPTVAPPPYIPPKPPTCPPSCPPINLKFFGTATRPNGTRQAFLLSGDDVFLASAGDIVARKYKIVSIAPNSLQVEDLANNNTQTLPLSVN